MSQERRKLSYTSATPEPKKVENCLNNEGLFRYLSALSAWMKKRFHEIALYSNVGGGRLTRVTILRKESGPPRDWAFSEWIREWGMNTWRVTVVPSPPGVPDTVAAFITDPVPDTNYQVEVTGASALGLVVGAARYNIYATGSIDPTSRAVNGFLITPYWTVFDSNAGDAFISGWNNYNSMVAALGLPAVPQVLEFDVTLRRQF